MVLSLLKSIKKRIKNVNIELNQIKIKYYNTIL